MKYQYGTIILETPDLDKALSTWKISTADDMKKGDFPMLIPDLDPNLYTFCLVVNSDDYVDCEYRFKFNSKIYSLSEFKDLAKKLKVEKGVSK